MSKNIDHILDLKLISDELIDSGKFDNDGSFLIMAADDEGMIFSRLHGDASLLSSFLSETDHKFIKNGDADHHELLQITIEAFAVNILAKRPEHKEEFLKILAEYAPNT